MKRAIALLLAMVLILSCVPAMALEQKYRSRLLNADVMIPDTLTVLGEFPTDEGDGVLIFLTINDTGAQITSTLQYVPEFVGMQTKDLPKTEIEGWKNIFSEQYPKRSKSMLIKPTYHSSQRIYRYYGQNTRGDWILNYSGVFDGLFVSTCCVVGQFGYKRSEMKAIFAAFNASFQLFAKSQGVDFVPFSPDDYEVEIFNLLYDDSPDSIFQTY